MSESSGEVNKDPYQGTSLRKGVSPEYNIDVEKMIREALEESQRTGHGHAHHADVSPAHEELKATPLPPPPPPPPTVPQSAAAPTSKESGMSDVYEKTFKHYKVGDLVKGTVMKVDPTGVLVDIGYKAEGYISPQNLTDHHVASPSEVVKVGDEVHAIIEKLEDRDGYVLLDKRHADYEIRWRNAYDAFKKKKVLEAKVVSVVRGGLVVDCGGIKGFIPASQVARRSDVSLDQFVGKILPIKILEIDRRQGKVILSHKMAEGEVQRAEADKLFEELEVGQVRRGVVTNLKTYGAFVDLKGVEGLLHISEMSWKKIKHPSEKLSIGQAIDVFVLGVDKVNRKVALGLRQLEPDPWVEAAELYQPGQIVQGKVVRLVRFGAFVELANNLEGLIHISELSWDQIQRPEDAVKVGDEVTVRVLRVIPEEQKIGLSLKEAKKVAETSGGSTEASEARRAVTVEDVLRDKMERAEESTAP